MLSIESPAPNESVGCTFAVKGNCSGGPISIVAKDSNGDPIPNSGKKTACNGGTYDTEITVCGVNESDVVTIEVSDGADTIRVEVVMSEGCPAC